MESDPSIEILVSTCERELLHLSGHIQPFGALLRVDRSTGVVTHASANLEQFLPWAAVDTVGKPASPVLAPLVETLPPAQPSTLVYGWRADPSARPLDVRLTGNAQSVLMEWEPTAGYGAPLRNVQEYPHPRMPLPGTEDELRAYHQILADEIRKITQFDRVMIYQFLEDWSGEVIAESTHPDRGSYRGLRFPASDIPAIARNLYQQNPYRMIPEANAESVPILSQDGTDLDLSFSDLRSVSPVHVLYLNHMSVVASFSVSILLSGKLWGLVACHHTQPTFLSFREREACAHLVHYYGLGIASFGINQRLHMLDSLPNQIDNAVKDMASSDDVKKTHGKLLELLEADGIVLGLGQQDLLAFGETPPPESMTHIDHWFMNRGREPFFATDHLCEFTEEIGEIAVNPSGMLAIKVKSPRSGWIRFFWFRNELRRQIAWAGNPNKPMQEDTTTQRLSPRRSFEKWIEEKIGYSQPWTQKEISISKMLRVRLLQWL
jgi:light-regulated signal transduction histidine kinase (bacteriophytochrome)